MNDVARIFKIDTDKVIGTVRVLSQGISIVSQIDGPGRQQPSPDYVLYFDANADHTEWLGKECIRTALELFVKRGNGELIRYRTSLHMMRTTEGWQHRIRTDQFQLSGHFNEYAGKRDSAYLVAALVDLAERIERDHMDFLLDGERGRLQTVVERAKDKVVQATEELRAAKVEHEEAMYALAAFEVARTAPTP